MFTYSKLECNFVEIDVEGILCSSDKKTGYFNEEWHKDEDYTIF